MAETPGGHEIRKYNEELVEEQPHFPRVHAAMRFGSLEHSHFNMFLRCVAASVPSPCTAMTWEGKLSLNIIAEKDPQLADLVRSGLRWIVLSPAITEDAQACFCISGAANAKHSLTMQETEISLICRLRSLCMESVKTGQALDRATLLQKALATNSHKLDDTIGFLDYVRCLGCEGGDFQYVSFFEAFCSKCVNPKKRRVSGDFFRSLVYFIPLTFPHVVNALLIAQYMNPSTRVLSTMISEGDLRQLKKKSHVLTEANARLGEVARTEGVDALKIYAYFMRVACHLTQKEVFFKDNVYKLLSQIPQPGGKQGGDVLAIVDGSASSRDAARQTLELVHRDEKGHLTDTSQRLKAEGITEGCFVAQRKGSGGDADAAIVAKVESIDTKITLRVPGKEDTENFSCDEILADWQVAETPALETQGWVLNWGASLLSQKTSGSVATTKHLILLALAQLSHQSARVEADGRGCLQIHTKPRLGVFFSTDYSCSRQFCLSPDATKVEATIKKTAGSTKCPGVLIKGTEQICESHFFWIPFPLFSKKAAMPSSSSAKGVDAPCVAPFFAAKRVKTGKQANAQCVYIAVESMWCMKVPGGDAQATNQAVQVPVIKLIEDVSVGDELVVQEA